jgi:hypothetical protein
MRRPKLCISPVNGWMSFVCGASGMLGKFRVMLGPSRVDGRHLRRASATLRLGLVWCMLSAAGCSSKQEGPPCVTHDECWSSGVGEALGRCAPKEMVCDQGTCSGSCAQACETIQADVNPCDDAQLVCNDARDLSAIAAGIVHCTGVEIACSSVDQCPLFLPPAPEGSVAAWSCEAGVCRYPGFSYKYQLARQTE